MRINFDDPNSGLRECPHCRFSMEYLRNSALLNTDEGYLLDTGTGWDPDDHVATAYLFGSVWRFLWRHFGEPLLGRAISSFRNRRYRRILQEFPCSQICTHCRYLLKRK